MPSRTTSIWNSISNQCAENPFKKRIAKRPIEPLNLSKGLMKERGIAAHSFMHLHKVFYILQAPVLIQTAKLTDIFEKLKKFNSNTTLIQRACSLCKVFLGLVWTNPYNKTSSFLSLFFASTVYKNFSSFFTLFHGQFI